MKPPKAVRIKVITSFVPQARKLFEEAGYKFSEEGPHEGGVQFGFKNLRSMDDVSKIIQLIPTEMRGVRAVVGAPSALRPK